MIVITHTMKKQFPLLLFAVIFSIAAFSQPTHVFTDAEKKFKEAKELFVKQQYALAYPLLQEVKLQYPDNQKSNNAYLNDDVNYYYIAVSYTHLRAHET